MLKSSNSYIRVRGFGLIYKNAKWDKENRINPYIDKILLELDDKKPTAVRQYLSSIQEMIIYKKKLHKKILDTITTLNYLRYIDSMQILIKKEIDEVIALIKLYEKED